ncbi:MAG TPA: patatin-like phospholipase family protein [Chthoniobacterales bacterium]|jgi:predicted acylesterase/phospholipase RssA|nr:patatin-like phospholipase family protein [Chthoniobacterales bacterium]
MPTANGQQPEGRPLLGGKNKTLRVYAFSGGGFDTAMQLGVVHAILLNREEERPELVTGISAGAISAVSLVEIIQAGEGLGPAEQRAAQVAKFRSVLEAYREGPLQLLKAQFPDGYETNSRRVTENLKLPIHVEAERANRDEAQRAESGLLKLINELLEIDLPMRQAVLLIRLVLAIREAREMGVKKTALAAEFGLLYWRIILNLDSLSLFTGRFVLLLIKANQEPGSACPAREVLFRKRRIQRRLKDAWQRLVGGICLLGLPVLAGIYVTGRFFRTRLKSKNWLRRMLQQWLPETWWRHFFSWHAAEECVRSVLDHYALAQDVGDSNALRQMFVDLFDPNYFGKLNMTMVTEAALDRRTSASKPQRPTTKKKLHHYSKGNSPLEVAILAADIAEPRVCPVPPSTAVVDALMAATAIAPIFRAVGLPVPEEKPRLPDSYFIDGENVNADPLRPTIKILQKRIHLETTAVRLYSAVPYPISKRELPEEKQYRGLVEVALRSLQLQRLQNALLERRFIDLYRKSLETIIGPNRAVWDRAPGSNRTGKNKPLIAASVISIEAEKPLRLNQKIPAARSHVERRGLIDSAVADGCRATIAAWLNDPAEPLHQTGLSLRKAKGLQTVSCRELLKAHFLRHSAPLPARPGSTPGGGPGLCEICQSCVFFRPGLDPALNGSAVAEKGFQLPEVPADQSVSPPERTGADVGYQLSAREKMETVPRRRESCEPTVSLLFSGGVFRGVYQIGVANALQVLNLRPNIVAGASVGSITAALVAQVFSVVNPLERRRQMASLAATYLALDRLILTDRFYDFVKRVTLRAGSAQFSPRDLDMLFRRYDEGSTADFSAQARRTIAGLERLLYLSPFELLELIQRHRSQSYAELWRLLGRHAQELLDRNGASLEILGAEPLALLLSEHLLRHHPEPSPRFDLFADASGQRKIHLLATVTNLTRGKLSTLGQQHGEEREWPILRDGLLASSAFPGVFRPRNSWEVYPGSPDQDQYVDGGVMDNLPLDSIVRFLDHASRPGLDGVLPSHIRRRPGTPHLIVTGSLEPNCYPLTFDRVNQITQNWVALTKRAREIGYNRKIHDFEVAQRDMSEIWHGPARISNGFEPIDIEVVTVKPEWLCGTFAFHPMLGFSRKRQAASIAHGCAGTLKQMRQLWERRPAKEGQKYFWGMRTDLVQRVRDEIDPEAGKRQLKGECWFCPGLACPFSEPELANLPWETRNKKLPSATRDALVSIYHECGKADNHAKPKGIRHRKSVQQNLGPVDRAPAPVVV